MEENKIESGSAEQLARRSLKALYTEVAEPIAKNVERIVLAAFEEIRNVRLNDTTEVKTKEEVEKEITEVLGYDSEKLINGVKERFKDLKHKQWHWSSFYNGWLEGRVNMLQQVRDAIKKFWLFTSCQSQGGFTEKDMVELIEYLNINKAINWDKLDARTNSSLLTKYLNDKKLKQK